MNNGIVRVAQIGTGHDHAGPTLASLRRLTNEFELIGIAETNPERVANLQREDFQGVPVYSVEQLLQMPDLDAVAVESDEELATHIAQRFLDRGVAVHLDKPGTANISAFEKLIHTAEAGRIPFHMGYMYRYNPMVKKCLEMIRSGQLGTIYSVEAQMSVHHSVAKRRWLEKYPGGMMYFLGCHLVDLILLLQGTPQEILPLNVQTGIDGTNATDYGFAVFRYAHGLSFAKACSVELNGYGRRQLVVCGSKGTVELKPLEEKYPAGMADDRHLHTPTTILLQEQEKSAYRNEAAHMDSGAYDRYDDMMREFAQIVCGKIANPYSYAYELQVFKAIMKCCGVE